MRSLALGDDVVGGGVGLELDEADVVKLGLVRGLPFRQFLRR